MTQDEGLLWKILKEDLPFAKQDHHGWSPMHAAAFHDEYIIGIWLEKRGCSLTSFNDVGDTPKQGLKIQQRQSKVFNNYQMNKFRIGKFDKINNADPSNNTGDDFSVGEKYVVHGSGDQIHDTSTTVYSISMGLDETTANTQVSIMNDSWNSGRTNVNHADQNTITIPRKVELNFQDGTTIIESKVSCAE